MTTPTRKPLSFREFVDMEQGAELNMSHVYIPEIPEVVPAIGNDALPAAMPPADDMPALELPPLPAEPQAVEVACTPRNLISALFSARDKAHQLHLRTKSFSAHMALGEFYDELLELGDQIAEVVQGKYGVMEPVVSTPSVGDDAVMFIQELSVWVETAHSYVPAGDTFINNLIDEVQALVYRTKYKLENLS